MKLIDILVEELKEWPEHAASACQSEVDKKIYFLDADGDGVYMGDHKDDYYSRYTADVRGAER